ncbi:NAD(P)H-dependent flavin oxidoreductase [Kibdelosporangium phytohabitans]|uniref:2-nitropropane dioxygenase n=1 Tax=Kibdelosporangium phytohabitans TaxID=860235 RepID=A0A0N9I7X9_9PSEU|nr:nitronate monooxygenase [Kibdelosporangium phytohabitans]ALG10619.1 2-nitropropane dioxygenase [Kibdelosporangium phytohabitans]MBE1461737.1 enoyl-[acyl-carrier protein] reductase II [Kibdelosporangium phytohabitans]
MRIRTPVTDLLGIDLPVVQAGMSWVSSASALPLAVSRAGGLGVVAAGPMRIPDLSRVIDEMEHGTDQPFAVNLPLYRRGVDEVMDLLVARRPRVLIASQGGPRRYLARFRDAGTICLHVVAGVEHAVKAAEAGVDGLVVVGAEAGGHPAPDQVSTLVVVRAVAAAVPELPVIASGGFADGAGLAAALAIGAGAVQFGTRFLLSAEANVHRAYQDAVLRAGITDTRLVGRGLGPVRALANEFAERMVKLEDSGADLDARRAEFTRSTLRMAAYDGDVVHGKVEAGQSAGLIDSVLPAGEIVRRIAEEYVATVDRLPRPD